MPFDPAAATAALVDGLGPEMLERAASYTAGNHWLLLWNLLVSGLVAYAVIRLGLLDRVVKRIGPNRPNLQVCFPIGLQIVGRATTPAATLFVRRAARRRRRHPSAMAAVPGRPRCTTKTRGLTPSP
jgi:hypothetical protein